MKKTAQTIRKYKWNTALVTMLGVALRKSLEKLQQKRILFPTAALLILVAALWLQVIAPRLLAIPKDFTYDASIISYDNFYNEQTGQFSGQTLSDTKFSYDVARAQGDILEIKNVFDVRTGSGEPIISISRLYGIDAKTGQHVPNQGDRDRKGYLFAPRNLTKQDFTYWHINYDAPANMKFRAEEEILGLKTYRYSADYHADQTKNLSHLPGVGKTRGVNLDINLQLWIEPTTGRLIKYEDRSTAYYYDLSTGRRLHPWNTFHNQYGFDSIASQVRIAERDKQRTFAVRAIIPMVLASIAFAMFIWAVADWRHRKEQHVTYQVAQVIAYTLVLSGLIAIAGWAFRNPVLPRLHPSFAAMHVVTASTFLALAVALWVVIRHPKNTYLRLLAGSLLGVVLVVQLIIVKHYFLGYETSVQHILDTLALPSTAAISPNTSLSLLCAGAALTLRFFAPKKHAAQVVAQGLLIAAAFLVSLSLIQYIYNIPAFYALDWMRSMTLTTTAAMVLLIIGIFAASPTWSTTLYVRHINKKVGLALFVLVTMLVITGVMWQYSSSSVAKQAEVKFAGDVDRLHDAVSDRLAVYINALQGGRGLFMASSQVTRSEWKTYVDGLGIAQNYPGIQGMGFAKVIPPAEKDAHIEQIRQEGFSHYTIRPEGTRDEYTAIVYLEPFDERNQRAFGYDMFSEPVRRAAMVRARDSGETTMSGKVTLVQETSTDVQAGFLIYVPVYNTAALLTSTEQRKAALTGYVYSAFRMNNFMNATISNHTNGLNVEVFDTTDNSSLSKAQRMYTADAKYTVDKGYSPHFLSTQQLDIAGHTWILRYTSLPGYDLGVAPSLSGLVLGGGILLSFLLAALVFILSSSRQRATELADRMTKDLARETKNAIALQKKDEAILGSIADGVCAIDMNGKVIIFNKAAEQLLGYTAEEVRKTPIERILSFKKEGQKGRKVKIVERALQGKVVTHQSKVVLKTKDGANLPVAVSAAPVMDERQQIGVIVVFQDVSEERRLERAKDEFVSLASHQLRTPLTATRLFSEMLAKGYAGPLNKMQKDYINKVHLSTLRMIRLVGDILNVSRIELNRLTIQPVASSLQAIAQNEINEVAPLAKEKGISIRLRAETLPDVMVDPGLMAQVLHNFLTNAIRYTPDHGGNITVSITKERGYYRLAVKDRGIGVPKDAQSKIGDRFYRADNAVLMEGDGAGLGLYLVKLIMNSSGGQFGFTSQEGKGSTFYIDIPKSGMKPRQGVRRLNE